MAYRISETFLKIAYYVYRGIVFSIDIEIVLCVCVCFVYIEEKAKFSRFSHFAFEGLYSSFQIH